MVLRDLFALSVVLTKTSASSHSSLVQNFVVQTVLFDCSKNG
jgi:hypothetical protein